MNKIALFTDTHLGINKDSSKKLTALIKSVDYFIDTCKKEKVKHVFFLGDWFHNRNFINVNTLHESIKVIEKLSEQFHLHFILGNHDLYLKNSTNIHSLNFLELIQNSLHNNIKVYKETTEITILDKKILCIPWLGDINGLTSNTYDMVLGHLDIHLDFFIHDFIQDKNTKNLDPNLINSYLSESELFDNKFDYVEKSKIEKIIEEKDNSFLGNYLDLIKENGLVFSGHFHKHEEIKYRDNKTFTFIGSLIETTFSDTNNEKGFYILDLKKDKPISYSFINNPYGIKHIKLKFSDIIKSFDNVINQIDHNKFNVIKITVDTNESCTDVYSIVNKILTIDDVIDCSIDFINSNFSTELFDISNTELNSIKLSKLEYLMKFIDLIKLDNSTLDINVLKDKSSMYFKMSNSKLYEN